MKKEKNAQLGSPTMRELLRAKSSIKENRNTKRGVKIFEKIFKKHLIFCQWALLTKCKNKNTSEKRKEVFAWDTMMTRAFGIQRMSPDMILMDTTIVPISQMMNKSKPVKNKNSKNYITLISERTIIMKRFSKKLIAILLAIMSIVSVFSMAEVSALAAGRGSSTNAFDVPTDSRYAKCYTVATTGQTPVYRSKVLTNGNRGTITYGASKTAHIDNTTDELYLKDVGTTSGYTWAKVNFPIGKGKRADGYIYLSALTCAKYSKSHLYYSSSLGKFYCSPRAGGSLNSNYYVSKGETVYAIALYGSQVQIMYPNGSGKWRIAYCSRFDADKYLDGNNTNGGGTSSFNPVWPCRSSNYISTMYRYYNGGNPKNHSVRSNIYNAFDIAGSSGDPIYAMESGTVKDAGYQKGGFGYYVVIGHSNGLYSLYGHLKSSPSVRTGQSVSRGQTIGYMGSTGASSGTHLHFEVYNPNNYNSVINPWPSYYQGKVSVTIGGNSYKANIGYKNDSTAQAWCRWLQNNCSKNSSGDYVYRK